MAARSSGYIGFREGWIQHLFIHPDAQGQGIGPALLAKALEAGAPTQLWTFQQNARARRFYEARGFRAVEFTDGAGNEEKTPMSATYGNHDRPQACIRPRRAA